MQVVDSGSGMTRSEMQKLRRSIDGQPPLAGEASVPIKGKGLFICRTILEQFGGSVSFHSYGRRLGSSFMFSMKMDLPEDAIQVRLPLFLAQEPAFAVNMSHAEDSSARDIEVDSPSLTRQHNALAGA